MAAGSSYIRLTLTYRSDGTSFTYLECACPTFTLNESAVSMMVLTEDQEEIDRYWNTIVGNGRAESACGWCKEIEGETP